MRIALVTTTINVPAVLSLYRRFDPSASVRFFVAGDAKTPHAAVRALCDSLGNAVYYDPQQQADLRYKCDTVIGWNSIQRRNIALLEALKWGADIIVSIDDDNVCLDPNYFHQFVNLFDYPFSGLQAKSLNGWFDVGQYLQPPATHRGFPTQVLSPLLLPAQYFDHVIDAKVGVAAGMVLGDPDTSSVERIAKHPSVHGVSEILKSGIVVSPGTKTVFNSQNSAIIRELAPAWSMWCGTGRYDDIFASLMVQRVMRDRGYHVHFGRPLVYQQRNQHDLTKDLASELWGMQNIVNVAEAIDAVVLPQPATGRSTVAEDTRAIFNSLRSLVPSQTVEAGLAFLEDCETVMK